MLLADVALPVPVDRAFSYEVPAALADQVVAGARVVCPFGSRRLLGVVLGCTEGAEPPPNVRAIVGVIAESPAVPAELISFLRELAAYYLAPIGEVFRLALPPVTKDVARALSRPTLFDDDARGIAARTVQWVVATDAVRPDLEHKLRGQARLLLEHVRAHGALPTARLALQFGNARSVASRLAAFDLVRLESRAAQDAPFFAHAVARDELPELTGAQSDAVGALELAIAGDVATTFVLFGVTGSGKTEVYLRAIGAARLRGKGALVLVPEIALTPQLVARYRARFGDEVAVIHSALTPRERLAMWNKLHRGEVDVAIGARSVVFAPVRSLGLVIVDEEHDSSFKQEEGVRYHARDMAILRAHRAGGVCVLGSATPSLESEMLARTGRAKKLLLPERARAQTLPAVEIVDLRRTGAGPSGDRAISLPLYRALEQTLAAGQQAIIFLNRRGFAPSVRCVACGELVVCPLCSVALTFHKRSGGSVRCHYCDHEAPLPERCAKCGAAEIVLEGVGTERLEERLAAAFPQARMARLDRDVASGKSIERVLERVRLREVDILVGTQMVTKGHDLPEVTLVGVINADAALSIPDFRASERAFQLLVQVAGRAGRGDSPGRVLIQTYTPDHPAITFAKRHDVAGFIERELGDRLELQYPPYARIALVRIDAVDEHEARDAALAMATAARAAAGANATLSGSDAGAVAVLGPAPAPIARVRNRFRFRIMLRAQERKALRRALFAIARAQDKLPRTVRCVLDIDPVQLL